MTDPVQRRWRRSRRAAAAGLTAVALPLAAAPAAETAERLTPPAGVAYKAAPRSALVTAPQATFVLAQWPHGGQAMALLARKTGVEGVAEPTPVALLATQPLGAGLSRTDIRLLPAASGAAGRADDTAAVVEQLYAMLLRMEPQDRYCLALSMPEATSRCGAGDGGLSHSDVLLALADVRGRVPAPVPAAWQVVGLGPVAQRSWDVDVVAVRAVQGDLPVEGLSVYFNRAPHSLCVARTGADGVARCRLVDQHGDEQQHDHATRVVATFPGDLRPDRVLLPTTHVLPAALTPPTLSFARPLVGPGASQP